MNDKGEWSLSPAYDITYANGQNFTKNHQMSIVSKVNNFKIEDLIELGIKAGIKKKNSIEIFCCNHYIYIFEYLVLSLSFLYYFLDNLDIFLQFFTAIYK